MQLMYVGQEVKKPDNVTDFKRRAIKMKVSNDGWVYTSEEFHSSQQSMSLQSTPAKCAQQDEQPSFLSSTPDRSRMNSGGSLMSSATNGSDLGGLVLRVDFSGESPTSRNQLEAILTHIHTHMTVGLVGKEKASS
jgi:hypothetical protein